MKTLLTLLLLIASPLYADDLYYLEVNDRIACLEFTNVLDAVNALPDVVAETQATNFTSQVHGHFHSEILELNRTCEIVPITLQNVGDDYVVVTTILTEKELRSKIPQFVATKYDGTDADSDKKAKKLKDKYFKNKVTRTDKEKREKKNQ